MGLRYTGVRRAQLRRSTFTTAYQLDDSVGRYEVTHVLRAVIAPLRTRRAPILKSRREGEMGEDKTRGARVSGERAKWQSCWQLIEKGKAGSVLRRSLRYGHVHHDDTQHSSCISQSCILREVHNSRRFLT